MRTTAESIARLSAEIESRFRGARVTDVGLLADGRTALQLHSRRSSVLLCLDVFFSPPLVTVEDGELAIAPEPGFVRALASALRGSTLLASKARKDDRLLRLTFGTRSRFGVGDEVDVYIELVPRFGNIVLVKRDTIVAAAKEFSLAENPARAVEAGMAYALPPLVARPNAPADPESEGSVLDAMRAFRHEKAGSSERSRTAQRRASLLRTLERRERKVRDELGQLAAKMERARGREALRIEGDAIFGTMHELDPSARDEAKERAAKLFAQYKKLGASIPHIEERAQRLETTLASIDALRWEADRAGDGELEDVERAVALLDGHRSRGTRPAVKRRKRAPLEVRTDHGSRILIGRSPTENAELTFHVARPNDLWFHAQGMPGAHVILQRDDREAPPEQDVERAASLAAFYSKGRQSGKVPIDYTLRKNVRAQKDAMAGLVWYTNPRTIVVEPRE